MAINNPVLMKSSDAGAPTLTGQVGAGITFLDKVLVGTAGIAYGTTPSLGWTKEFSATNIAVYRNDPAFGSGCYLRVDDTDARDMKCTVYKSMSDANTGSNPTREQYVTKSNTADSTARPWCINGDNLTFYLMVGVVSTSLTSVAATGPNTHCGFGDYSVFGNPHGYNYFAGAHQGPYNNSANYGFGAAGDANGPYNNSAAHNGLSLMTYVSLVPTVQNRTGLIVPNANIYGLAYQPENMAGRGGKSYGGSLVLPNPDTLTGVTYYIDAIIGCGGGFPGKLRGVLIPLNDMGAITTLIPVVSPRGISGETGNLIPIYPYTISSSATTGVLYFENGLNWGL